MNVLDYAPAFGLLLAPWMPDFFKVNIYFQYRKKTLAKPFKFLCGIVSSAIWTWMVTVESKNLTPSFDISWHWMLVMGLLLLIAYWLLWMKYHARTQSATAGNSMLGIVALSFILIVSGSSALASSFGLLKIEMENRTFIGKIIYSDIPQHPVLYKKTAVRILLDSDSNPIGSVGLNSRGEFKFRLAREVIDPPFVEVECSNYETEIISMIPGSIKNIEMHHKP